MQKCAFEIFLEVEKGLERKEEALLIVAFPKKTRIVRSNASDRLYLLDELLEQGGIPVGHLNLGTIKAVGDAVTSQRIFDERRADQWVKPFMSVFVDRFLQEEEEKLLDTIGIDQFRTRDRAHNYGELATPIENA
jgi:hypothetical protein